ncbi:hypothetical protein RHRU231_620003 [Rhodococcus ruber]|uniref:Uncharacterized protein n=2 Tax=Nocardiaceae TaxID=85025 RepID=A0A098BPE4_9NOCA|nr:hypothetical protein YT1_0269 [Rhodococcus ruber]CCW13904.1 hypothetical protein EBESD8_44680 [Rhodococcus aetherivorans]CDZ90112.1 hypothetical protein RHRU231_620003 [Rhodococcus ruber]
MSRMAEHLRSAYTAEMTAARRAANNTNPWRHLERAHIISQPYPGKTGFRLGLVLITPTSC